MTVLLAHAGGIDEIAVVVGPLLVAWLVYRWWQRRGGR